MTTGRCFTVIESLAPARLGKSYSIGPDGKLTKSSVASITKGRATTLAATPENIAAALSLATESDNIAIVLDSFIGSAHGSPAGIEVVTEDELQRLTGGKIGDANGQGFFAIESTIVSARLKRLMQSSGWILIDADTPEGMPEHLAKLTLAGRLARLEPVLPGVSKCQRIEYLGSSARVVNGSGAPKPESTHAIIAISDPAKLTLLRDHLRVESVRHGLSFQSARYSRTEPDTLVGHAQLTVVDWAVWSPGRLIFNAKPNVGRAPGYRVLNAGVRIVNPDGGALDIGWIKPPDEAALKYFRDKTGLDIRLYNGRGGGLAVHEKGALKLSTAIESRGTVKPLADWLVEMLDGDKDQMRCETPFRASTSEAAFIRITESDEIFVHDSGTATSFYLDRLDEHAAAQTTDAGVRELMMKVIAAKARQAQRQTQADPLTGLVERTAKDAGAPFAPEVLQRLVILRKEDRAAFEGLRAQLKKAGCRLTALDEALDEATGEGDRKPTQATILIDQAKAAAWFHTRDRAAFADCEVNGHRETWPIRSKGFRHWLARGFFEATQGAPSSEALQSALNVIESKANYDGLERVVHVRVAALNGKLYLDLADESWRAVELDASGWRVIDKPPVRFRRSSGMQPLPIPVPGGSIDPLRSFLNVQSEDDFVLAVSWVLAGLRDRGPYPVIVLCGEQGSAKSTLTAVLRGLLDPNTAPLRALPREDRDLFIAATNGHVLAFDNVSGLPAWISDTLCRLATGGGFAVRALYTDQDEVLFDASRPVILNGIEDMVSRPDLADRALFLRLNPIAEEERRPESELWAAFGAERPRILGALLDAAVEGLRRLPKTRLSKLPRMADFALWATACERTFWKEGTFSSAYSSNRDEAIDNVIDADPVANAVRAMMQSRMRWTGTASDLLDALGEVAGEPAVKSKSWPDSVRLLSGRLRRAATFLRKIDINISFEREGQARTRTIVIATSAIPF